MLPEICERRKILEEAGMVLAEAQSLVESLDRAGGKLIIGGPRVLSPRQGFVIKVPKRFQFSDSRWWRF